MAPKRAWKDAAEAASITTDNGAASPFIFLSISRDFISFRLAPANSGGFVAL